MYFCLVIAFLMTFLWIDSLVVSSINARVNPYQKTDEDKNRDEKDAKKRTAYIVIASLFWAAVIFFI